ncbi:hypothetical protein GZH47_33205 (plasmid) [Paenibacillus rhizovicinus]|uniref:Uncharacterized protein n=1 Tax=Paenibacillus rhizovicinus TaxID=2704463 RepID=A0A6C0PCK2_9BACL|nr:hypothetical protein [Paenibacillus rhizovicinus]QHW35753.1 hypothetical protein GZH47_33205 [Paenibacillus rhizovicinus]
MSVLIANFLVSLEWLTIVILLISLFNLSFSGFIPHIIFISWLMAFVGWGIDQTYLSGSTYALLIQVIALYLCTWLILRINVFYAFGISVVSYGIYMITQSALFLGLHAISFMDETDLVPLSEKQLILQGLSIAVPLLISYLATKLRIRYNLFVPTTEFIKLQFNRLNNITVFVLISMIGISVVNFHFITEGKITLFILISVIQLACVALLLYLFKRKEGIKHDRKVVRKISYSNKEDESRANA